MAQYKIASGDTLSGLATKYGTSVQEIQKLNPTITNPNLIYAGQSLNLPDSNAQMKNPVSTPVTNPVTNPADIQAQLVGAQSKLVDLQTQLAKEKPIEQGAMALAQGGGSINDYEQYMKSQNPAIDTSAKRQELSNQYGISDLQTKAFSAPEKTFSDIYTQIVNQSGLPDLIARQTASNETLTKLENSYNEELKKIQMNPWQTVGTRNKDIQRLNDNYNRQKVVAQNEYSRLTDDINNIKNEAKNVATQTLNEFGQQQELDQTKLEYFLKRIDEDIQAEQLKGEQAQNAQLYRYLPDFLKIQNQPTGTSWAGGNVGGGAELSSAFKTAINQGISNLQKGEDWGTVWTRIKTLFPNVSDETIDNSLGVNWREAGAYEKFKGGGTGVQLSATVRDELATMDTVKQTLNNVVSLGEKTNWGGVGGLYAGSLKSWFAKNLGVGTEEEQQLRSMIGNVKGTVAKLRGGTSFTPNEEKLLNSYTPDIDDSPLVIKAKIKSLIEIINQKRDSFMGTGNNNQSMNDNNQSSESYDDYLKSIK